LSQKSQITYWALAEVQSRGSYHLPGSDSWVPLEKDRSLGNHSNPEQSLRPRESIRCTAPLIYTEVGIILS